MKTVLDATALVALLKREPAADAVRTLVVAGDVAITVLDYGEALDTVARTRGVDLIEVQRIVDALELDTTPVTPALAARGASIRVSRYHRSRCPVSLADCIAVAAARGAALATSDRAQADAAVAEGVEVVALPTSVSG